MAWPLLKSYRGTKTGKQLVERNERKLAKEKEMKACQENALVECDVDMFETKTIGGSLNDLTIPQLKVYCVAFGLSHRGNKRNLIISIEDHVLKRRKM